MKKKMVFPIAVLLILVTIIAACATDATPTQPVDIQVTKVTENELVYGEVEQNKLFDQCASSSIFKTNIQFSDSSAQSNQKQLVLGAEITGGVELSPAVKVEISGFVEQHFSETKEQAKAHFESANIEVPAHTKQEYTIIWRETRRNGTVEYIENGQKKSLDFSYRVGLELI